MRTTLWVTGLGLVTPLGVGVEATWSRLVRGDRAIAPIRLFDVTGQRARIAGEVEGVEVPAGGWSRTSAMAAQAAEEAMRAALVDVGAQRVGLVVGGTTAGMFETEHLLARLHAEPEHRESLAAMLSHPLTSTGDRLDEKLGPFSRVRTLSSACSSGANAIVVGAGWLLADEVDVVVAGGGDGLCRLTMTGFNALGALDPEPCRPFDLHRRGTTLGEGAGFLVIERAEHARARGAVPVAALVGWAVGAEAHHITNPAQDGTVVADLVTRAIERAELTPRDVDYVNAHGTGTRLNDAMEAAALRRALGDDMARVPVSSSKGQIGHTLGAAGAIEAAITALVVARRTLVPTVGLEHPDPDARLVHVRGAGMQVPRVRAALTNAFGFGGMDTVLVLADTNEASDGSGARRRRLGPSHAPVQAVITGAAIFGPSGLLGTPACETLVQGRPATATEVDADSYLDAMRARRLDRAARFGAVAVQRALAEAGAPAEQTGVVLGSAFGNVDGSAAFMHRLFERGPRAVSPAEFPNLVPSSLVGHVSIYLGLRGPAFATADLAASGESAFAQAAQLVRAGEAPRVVAGSVETKSGIVERVFAALLALSPEQPSPQRVEVAAAIVVESEPEVARRGGRPVARVKHLLEWRRDAHGALSSLAPPAGRAEVVLPHGHAAVDELLALTPWRSVPRLYCASGIGDGDGLGAVAVAVAAARVAAGRADEALVLGLARGRGYAFVLAAP